MIYNPDGIGGILPFISYQVIGKAVPIPIYSATHVAFR
ncbi:MAG: hypothetical protein ACI9WM_000092, partial [Arenicella sp.]